MSKTDSYRKQHDELVGLVGQISGYLNEDKLKDATDVSKLLATMAGKIKVHLAMEDNALYPALLKSTDSTVSGLAKKYQDEMTGIKRVFDGYVGKWGSAPQIQSDPKTFIKETNDLFKALGDRIRKESNELYPAYDKAA